MSLNLTALLLATTPHTLLLTERLSSPPAPITVAGSADSTIFSSGQLGSDTSGTWLTRAALFV